MLVPTVAVFCNNVLWLAFPNYACVVACDLTLYSVNCVSIENFVQLVDDWKVRVYKIEKTACNVCFDVLAEWKVKPNDVALSVPAWLLYDMWHVFQLVAEVAMS